MPEKITHYSCPNCSAPVLLPLGEVDAICEYCGSHLRFLPSKQEMEVVRTREEMKYRERVAVQKALLEKNLRQEELARWRNTAGKVAIAALPVVGDVAGRALFRSALSREGSSPLGCGCIALIALITALLGLFGL